MALDLSAERPTKLVLIDARPEDILADIQFGMTYQAGKARSRQAHDLALGVVARMVLEHLTVAGYVIKRKPPAEPLTTHGKWYLTD